MSGRVRTRSKSKQRKGNPESNQPAAPVAAQQPSDNQPQQEQAPTESQDIMPDQEKEVKEALVDQGPDLESGIQELPLPKTGGISEDDSDVKGADVPTVEPMKMPEAGMLSIENAK
ncbi:P antigen family member 3-like [Panthera pardus]|uniref:P antigen family member 3-like n=1 Tax=Panthera pardus TaxID=9691 RepID=A0A9W2UTP0_PANPR|nr:P antigen family member 3-like [Panthera pardus]XP_053749544.1 P antigen family member 3-like [Panthera pardus]XP_053749545.1 P antigen family member 3-like [Panthera pardus]XP_053749546.1 P antigen family member 3-like [Panthera pardus]